MMRSFSGDCKKVFGWLFDVFLPLLAFYYKYHNCSKYANDFGDHRDFWNGKIEEYKLVKTKDLEKRLKDEYKRSVTIDDKTIKFNFVFNFALLILNSFISVGKEKLCYLTGFNTISTFGFYLEDALLVMVFVYSFMGVFIAVGALKTEVKFGIATATYIKRSKLEIIEYLISQETINLARSFRNQFAYQCILNSLILFVIFITLQIICKF